ncbi:MAG: EamA family transporter [Candidatus Dormibacteria bacterium]
MTAAFARARTPATLVVLALVSLYFLWGSTYIGIRIAVRTMPPFLLGATRFLAGGALMFAWAGVRGDLKGARPSARHWLSALIVGGLLLGVANGGVMWSEQYVDAGVAALIIAAVPVYMALIGHFTRQERLTRLVGLGLVLGIAGVVIVAHPWSSHGTYGVGTLVLLGASLAWAGGSMYARQAPLPNSAVVVTAMEMVCAGALLGIAAVVNGDLGRAHPGAFSPTTLLALLYLVVFGSIVGFSAYVYLLKHVSAALAGTYAFVNPAVAVLLGALVLGEPVTVNLIVGGAVVIAGVALVVAGRSIRFQRGRRLPAEAAA